MRRFGNRCKRETFQLNVCVGGFFFVTVNECAIGRKRDGAHYDNA